MSKLNPNAGEFVPSFTSSSKPNAALESLNTVQRYSIPHLLEFRDICDLPPTFEIPDSIKKPNSKSTSQSESKSKLVYSVNYLRKFESCYKNATRVLPDMKIYEDTTHHKKKSKQKRNREKKKFREMEVFMHQYDHELYNGIEKNMSESSPMKITENPEEESRQSIQKANVCLNKLSRDNFDTIVDTFERIEVTCTQTLHSIIGVIFERAMAEPMFCDLYAKLCKSLSEKLPEFKDGARTINFRRVLLTKCYEALVEEPQTQLVNSTSKKIATTSPSQTNTSECDTCESISWKRQSMLGNVVFIGELFRRHLLTENIMHMCIAMMLDNDEAFSVEVIEAACRLILLVGDLLDGSSPASRRTMDEYFDVLQQWSFDLTLEKRIRFLIRDTIDLRSNGWISHKKDTSHGHIEATLRTNTSTETNETKKDESVILAVKEEASNES